VVIIYTKKTVEHFLAPQNCYFMDDATVDVRVGDSSCGDSLWLFLRIEENILTEVSYLVQGCPASIATSSMTSILAKGKTIEQALKIEETDVIKALGGLPNGKEHCSNLGIGALREAINKYL
jgi:nitrogen fixation NifU-like protein